MRPLPALCLALLVCTAGCGSLSGGDADSATVAPGLESTPTATPTATSSTTTTVASATTYPPGVTPAADDEVDERALYLAHHRALTDRSVMWRHQQVWTNDTGAVVRWSAITVRMNGSLLRYAEAGGSDPPLASAASGDLEYWTNGSVTVFRQTLPNGSVQRQITEGGPPVTFDGIGSGRSMLASGLTGWDLSYVGALEANGTTTHLLAGTTEDARLTLRVTPAGVVESLVLRTTVRRDGTDLTLVRRFEVIDVGDTTVDRPPWARNVSTAGA